MLLRPEFTIPLKYDEEMKSLKHYCGEKQKRPQIFAAKHGLKRFMFLFIRVYPRKSVAA